MCPLPESVPELVSESQAAYCSASRSRSRAFSQSRRTVRSVTPSASEISASLIPPKDRSSTTWTMRPSSAAMRSRASCTPENFVFRTHGAGGELRGQGDAREIAAAPPGFPATSEIDDDGAHHTTGPPHEVHAVLEPQMPRGGEPQIGLVDQRGRVERGASAA